MKICIECNESVAGKRAVKVKEDRIIRLIRIVKQKLNIAANNELYVCEKDIDKHIKRRKDFEKNMVFFSILAGLVVLAMVASMLLSESLNIWAVFSSIVIGMFILTFAVVFKYAPALEDIVAHPIPGPPPESEEKDELEEKPEKESDSNDEKRDDHNG